MHSATYSAFTHGGHGLECGSMAWLGILHACDALHGELFVACIFWTSQSSRFKNAAGGGVVLVEPDGGGALPPPRLWPERDGGD